MEYTVQKLACLAGVTPRTIRHYTEIGLLSPDRINSSGYRIYGSEQVDILQQILFYRELDFDLNQIKQILADPNFDKNIALNKHLEKLSEKRKRLDLLISTVEKTIKSEKGEITMLDKEKFEGLKNSLIQENEDKYGEEIREKYGNDVIDEFNLKFKNMSKEEYERINFLADQIILKLEDAVDSISTESSGANEICEMHKEFLNYSIPNFNSEIHLCIADMYVCDKRFTEYYDKNKAGCAKFLRDAIYNYYKK